MIKIKVITENGSLRPKTPLPTNAIQIDCDGAFYTVYMQGDELPPKTAPTQTQEEINAITRKEAVRAVMRDEADPIFFKWQAGEATKQDWLEKRAEIKAR